MQPSQPSPRFQLLGLPCVALEAGAVPLGASRPIQLLAHLAVRGSWQSRDDVARLFWPDRPNKVARGNLRNLLFKTAAAAPFAQIESTEHALRLQTSSDLNDFEAAVQRGDREAAVQIGRDELLLGFEAHASEPYLLWLHCARTAQLAQWTQSVQAMLADTTRLLEHRLTLAQVWAARCPYDEDAVSALVSLAFERQQPAAAVVAFRAFEARLQEEFGVRPSRALERFALEPALRAAHGATASQPTAASTPAPRASGTRLFGRRLEFGQLKRLLDEAAVPLITLTGPGGVGKSTLLGALFEHCAADRESGACLVDASAAQNSQGVIAAIAAALGIEGLHGADNEVALAATLRDRRCMLLIDGAEQPGLAEPLALLLERCPHTRLVVAARSRLLLDHEHVLVLDGFPLPDADETDAAVLGSNDAVRFFVDLMSHAGQPVNLARDAATLAAIVHAVEGLPLALKLLAKLTRVLSLEQLLGSMNEQMAVAGKGSAIAASSPALGELMPALVASFERSWAALSRAEQAVLARLAVFPAAFDWAAARAVAAAELPLITSLLDRSLVRTSGAGRLSLHAGIRACVLSVCPLSDGAVAAYLDYYAHRLAVLADTAKAKTVRPIKAFLRNEADHVEQAWRLASQRLAYPAMMSMVESLFTNIEALSNGVDYGQWFVEAELRFHDDNNAPLSLRALLLAGTARLAGLQGRAELAAVQARDALRLAQRAKHSVAIYRSLTTLSLVCLAQNRLKEAEAMIERAIAFCSDTGEAYLRSQLHFRQGDLETALRFADELILVHRRFEDSDAVVRTLINKTYFCGCLGSAPRSAQLLGEAIDAAGASDVSRALEVVVLGQGATMNICGGDFPRARACLDRANAIASGIPQTPAQHWALQLANAAVEVETSDLLSAGLRITEILGGIGRGDAMPLLVNNTLWAAARWFRSTEEGPACRELLISRAARFDAGTWASAQAMLRELGEEPLPPHGVVALAPPEANVAEVATRARSRMLTVLDAMQRSKQPLARMK